MLKYRYIDELMIYVTVTVKINSVKFAENVNNFLVRNCNLTVKFYGLHEIPDQE